mgnify:CR=1 FL=1
MMSIWGLGILHIDLVKMCNSFLEINGGVRGSDKVQTRCQTLADAHIHLRKHDYVIPHYHTNLPPFASAFIHSRQRLRSLLSTVVQYRKSRRLIYFRVQWPRRPPGLHPRHAELRLEGRGLLPQPKATRDQHVQSSRLWMDASVCGDDGNILVAMLNTDRSWLCLAPFDKMDPSSL